MSHLALIADVYLSWLPSLTEGAALLLGVVCLGIWAVLRLCWGKTRVHKRFGLMALRMLSLLIVIVILLGPTIVDEQAGEVTRPSMVMLYDGSQSMQLGKQATRWQQAFEFTRSAEDQAGAIHQGDLLSFRFGHRLSPLQAAPAESPEVTLASTSGDISAETAMATTRAGIRLSPPNATDSRLADAMRQLLPQVNSRSNSGVVLFSDGRVRSSETVEQLAEYFGGANVPVHVVPIGQASGAGDIAIVSLVVPPRVRKYTENELQVFLRSFGYREKRTVVSVRRRGASDDDESATLASLPITLAGGAQSASLTFRVDDQPEDLVVQVEPLEGELTTSNNRVTTRIDIDRTKVRVLMLTNERPGTQTMTQSLFSIARASTGSGRISVASALQADEDIECTTLYSAGGSVPRLVTNSGSSTSSSGFPRTRAELFAYDSFVISNVPLRVLTEEQTGWLAQWIEGRGGSMVVVGDDALRQADWQGTPLQPLLPVILSTESAGFPSPVGVRVTRSGHPVWRLRMGERLNTQLLAELPELAASAANHRPKATADVLAVQTDGGQPVIACHRVGRGRVLVSTASLAGTALELLASSWGPQPERVAGKLWRNIVYWATEGSSTGRRRLIAQSDKRFYQPGQRLTIYASAYDEAARRTQKYRVWAMFEPESLDDMSLYSPILWPDNVVRDSGEVGPRIAWGEELQLGRSGDDDGYQLDLTLSETGGDGDSGLRVEMTAYEGQETDSGFDHGTQVDSTSLAIQILSDPFEQQNPLPNHELLRRVATVSGGSVLEEPAALAKLLRERPETIGPPKVQTTPAWSRWWLWGLLLGLISTEWIWRRATGLA
ncbi:MAG: hypothetical protein AAGA03_12700 [Planctomycetota bacterium]